MGTITVVNNVSLDGVMQGPGSGRRLFTDRVPVARLKLVDSVVTTTGVVIASYETV